MYRIIRARDLVECALLRRTVAFAKATEGNYYQDSSFQLQHVQWQSR